MKKNMLLLIVVFAMGLSGCQGSMAVSDSKSGTPTASPVPATAPAAAPIDAVVNDKCSWMRINFPQTTEEVQALGAKLASVDPKRVRTHVFRCTPTQTVFDGMTILGPNEGWNGEFTLQVPANGAVDSYQAAKYTGKTELLGPETDTMRAYDGSVTAVTATYWPWLDENPPLVAADVSTKPAEPVTKTTGCIDPKDLAKDNVWTYSGTPDKYGGLQVTLTSVGTLSDSWMANGEGGIHIGDSDTIRTMRTGVWTIYPPFSCREELGYSQ